MENEKCLEFQQLLNKELRPYVVPVLIGTDLSLCPSKIENASGFLLKFGSKKCLLTCYHVWEKYLKIKTKQEGAGVLVVLLHDGYGGAFHIEHPKLLIRDENIELAKELDLAIIDLTNLQDFFEKVCFPLSDATIHNAVQGDIIVGMGFPGIWRKSEIGSSLFSTGPLPLVVGDITQRLLIVPEANKYNREVFDYLDAEPRKPNSKDSCGGLSGAPFFNVSKKPFKIAGFIQERALGALKLTRASVLMELIQ